MEQIQIIDVKSIITNQQNPRKDYREESIKELSVDIAEHGIINPLTVRPKGKKFEIICGERRYKASIIANLTQVPCIVRNMSDEEAMELMLSENLHRVDITPLEEAVAYASLIETRKLTIADLSARVGKSESYIRIRLNLNLLIEQFKEYLIAERIGISHALILCKLSNEVQLAVFEKFFNRNETVLQSYPSANSLQQYVNTNLTNTLADAGFDLADETLIKACTTCADNTSSDSLLFPDQKEQGKCLNTACLEAKKQMFLKRKIETIAESEPDVLLVSTADLYADTEKEFKSMINQGLNVIDLQNSQSPFKILRKPEEPEKPEAPERDDYASEDDYKDELENYNYELNDYEEESEEYIKDLAEYEEKIKSARKAFVAIGSSAGEYIYLQPRENTSVASTSNEELAKQNINSLIKELEQKDKRNLEIKDEKISEDLTKKIQHGTYHHSPDALTGVEEAAMLIIMMSDMDIDVYKEVFNTDVYHIRNREYYQIAINLTPEQKNIVIRNFIRKQLLNRSYVSSYPSEAHILQNLMLQYDEAIASEIIEKHTSTYNMRHNTIEEKIKELQGTIEQNKQ